MSVTINPGTSIQTVVDANPAGTTYILAAGTHINQDVKPKAGDTFTGAGVGVTVLDGNNVTQFAFRGYNGAAWVNTVTISNLTIKRYNPPSQNGAIWGGNDIANATAGWVLNTVEVMNSTYYGVRLGNTMQVLNCNLHHNGTLGIGGLGNGVIFDGNELAYNNATMANDPGFESGGSKLVRTDGLIVRNNYVHHNGGPGIWLDISNINYLIESNRSEDNVREGIVVEISYAGVIRNNIVRRNGFGTDVYRPANWLWNGGIAVHSTSDVEVYGNAVEDNFNGIVAIQQNRGAAFGDPPEAFGPYIVQNLNVHDNTVKQNTAQGPGLTNAAAGIVTDVAGGSAIFTSRNNHFTNNHYTLLPLGGGQSPGFEWQGWKNDTQWKAIPNDATGTFSRVVPTPSTYRGASTDGADVGYDKSTVDALMVVALGGDRRTFTYQNYSGSYTYRRATVAYPRTWLSTDVVPVRTGIVWNVTNDATMATALAGAAVGDWIVIAVATYTGTYNAPMRAGAALPGTNAVIVLIGKQVYDSLVGVEPTVLPRKKRVNDADKLGMPYFKCVSLGNAHQWSFDGGTAGFRHIGLRFGADATVTALSRLIRVGNGDSGLQSTVAGSPQNIGYDRCHFDGHSALNLKAAIELHGRGIYIQECYFGDDIHHTGQDCQAIRSYNGAGPYRIVNNRICASTENWMFGGAFSTAGSAPRDIEVRWNLHEKLDTWNPTHPTYAGTAYSVKNLSEVKKAKNILIEGNYFRKCWASGQVGAVINCKSESYGDGAVNGYTSDVLFRWNYAEKVAAGFYLAGITNTDAGVAPENCYSVGNLIVMGEQYYAATASSFWGAGRLSNSGSIHDTFISKGIVLNISAPGGAQTNWSIYNSVFGRTTYGLKGASQFEGKATLDAYCPGYDVLNNIFTGRGNTYPYPTGNFFPIDETAIRFTNYAAGDYSLEGYITTAPPPPPDVRVPTSFATDIAPSGGNSGSALATQPRFKVLDDIGGVYPLNTGTVTASVVLGTGTVTAGSVANFVNGRAQFAGLTFTTPFSNDLTVRFTPSNGMTPIDIIISEVAAVGMGILIQPSDGVDNVALPTQPKVQLLDAVGNPLALAGKVITATPNSQSDGLVSHGNTATTNSLGQAQFVGLALDVTADFTTSLRFGATGVSPVDSVNITVTAAPVTPPPPTLATQLVCTRAPSGAKKGLPLKVEPRYEWQDDNGVLVPTETATVTLRVEGNATTVGTNSIPAVGGVADFAGTGFGINGRGKITLIAEGTP